MGIFRFDIDGQIAAFEEKPNTPRLAEIGSSLPPGARSLQTPPGRPFIASMGIYVFSRQVLLEVLEQNGIDFGKEIIPQALGKYSVNAFLHRGYWADVGTIGAYYDANLMLTRPDAPFRFHDPKRPIYTHPRQLPPARLRDCTVRDSIIAEGSSLDRCTITESVVGVRMVVRAGCSISRTVLVGADSYESEEEALGLGDTPRLGIGRDVVIDRAIVDKNARIGDGCRLTNEGQVQEADGDGWHIRTGIVIVPKSGVVKPGTVV
jgi:glucose-1-phosphate adenylyltransferase